MNEEQKREDDQRRYGGLTTAPLAAAGGATALMTDIEPRPQAAEPERQAPAGVAAGTTDEPAAPLFAPGETKDFRVRWDTIQGGFVDEPRRAVEQADALVAGAMARLAEIFAEERAKLEGQWDREGSVSTEDLRLALRRYRSFFGRLLSV